MNEISNIRKNVDDYLKSGADKDKVIEDLVCRIEKLTFEFRDLFARKDIVKIPCGLCENVVSLFDCLNKGWGLGLEKTGKPKIVCSDCVLQYGVDNAVEQA